MSTLVTKPVMLDETGRAIEDAIRGLKPRGSVASLSETPLAVGTVVEAVGVPVYVKDVSQYSAYGLTDKGWYVFARITAADGIVVTAQTVVTGAAGVIQTVGADHVDVAVRFGVTAESQPVTVNWGDKADTYVFKATDLAVRNLDYRTTFYVYDLAEFCTWQYALTPDTAFVAGSHYYTESGGVYTEAEVQTVAYQLTADETFQNGKTYYTKSDDTYTAAEVTVGEAVTPDTYYEQTTVPVPAYYTAGEDYVLTKDTTFAEGKTYYTKSTETYVVDVDVYTPAEVTAGAAIPANTYYELTTIYTQATGVFEAGVTYYTKSGDTYAEATVTAGEPIPAYYKHSKLTIEGMARNVTYQLDTPIDCATEFVLPAIEDDGHGAWFEFRFRHLGSYSSTLLPEDETVKVATEHTQAETAGMNMVDLHYMSIDGVKIWRFMNTHSSIPT